MNQSPQTGKQTGKRIVSKGEYAKVQGQRAGLRSGALVLYLVALFFLLKAVSCLMALLYMLLTGRAITFETAVYTVLFLLMGTGAHFFRKWAKGNMRRASEMGKIVPLTRANTADLPAPDSLVRASAEPVQEQEAVLLRAATAGMERHEEQLLRAVEGGTE